MVIAEILIYLLAAKWTMRCFKGIWRERLFALINLFGAYAVFAPTGEWGVLVSGAYFALVGFQYLLMRYLARREDRTYLLAFFTPILALIFIRYVPSAVFIYLGGLLAAFLDVHSHSFIAGGFVGISYLAFRSSRLVLEVRNGSYAAPSFWKYVSFCFFLPTLAVGPISTFGVFDKAFQAAPQSIQYFRAMLRILIGLVKYIFLANLCNQLGYEGLLLDGWYHSVIELCVAATFYYLFLYLNFSGFCDMAIGAAGLIGIEVPENFDNPFVARNVKDFWNRWHITLSQYMRDVVFAPLSKYLTGLFGIHNINHAVAVAIVVVFLLVGIWHGVGWNYACFGAIHALGVVTNHYYTVGLKKWLGRDGLKAYNANIYIRSIAIGLTFIYVSGSLSFFANSFDDLRKILATIWWTP